MKNYKKILAGVLATSMVLGNSAVVFADEGGQAKGSGKVEGQVKTEVFSVVLPTEADYAGAFDYIIDPLQLIANDAGNNGTKYDKTKYDFDTSSTVFFYNGVDNAGMQKYTNTSSKLAVENKSSGPVKLVVSLRASGEEGIVLTSDENFKDSAGTADSIDPSLYLEIKGEAYTKKESDGSKTPTASSSKQAGINSNGVAAFEANLDPLVAEDTTKDAFVTQWNPIRNTYEYVENTAENKTTTGFEFEVTGMCNPNPGVKWLDALSTGKTPELEIVWGIQDPTGPQIALDETNKKITISNLTPDQGYVSLTLNNGTETWDVGSAADSTWDNSGWNAETSSGTFAITYADWCKDWMSDKLMTLTLTLTDGSTRTNTFIGAHQP